jgi:iron complex outermembrane recepter protein
MIENRFLKAAALVSLTCSFIPSACLFAQDTTGIDEVKVVTYVLKQNLFQIPAAAASIDSSQLSIQKFNSLLPALNTIPGVRMEERSPGSYRFSIRGSLLRSPFGIRNIKIYFDEFPLTDAGGNTYLNAVPAEAVNRIEILKGPDGSLFGANSGGVVTLFSPKKKNNVAAGIAGGNFGLFKESVQYAHASEKNDFMLMQGYYLNDGYRQNSRMRRFYLQGTNNWHYTKNNELRALFFSSSLYYQTPGGLNNAQYQQDPRQARQPTATLPGAAAQKAAVYNDMLFGGITHTSQVSKHIQHIFSLFASSVDFRNPFITNYEERKEKNIGTRTYFIFRGNNTKKINWEYNIGAEWQQSKASVDNYQNLAGEKGALVAAGKISTRQYFIFNRLKMDLSERLIAEAGLSLNNYQYQFSDSFVLKKKFTPQWMPRLALSYAVTGSIVFRSSISRGYAPPTTAEIRPSDNRLNTTLQPETGLNLEFGARYFSFKKKLWVDISLYHYQLSKAIVQQQNNAGAEFFINAGSTDQRGVEMQASYLFISPHQNKQVQKLSLGSSATYAHYVFDDYVTASGNYSGNLLTGVPRFTLVNSFTVECKNGLFAYFQHNHSASVPLNDGNTVYAKPFDILQIKAGINVKAGKAFSARLTIGVDNLFNENYSLGNDLNAAAGRYYNAAPLRNYFIGMMLLR